MKPVERENYRIIAVKSMGRARLRLKYVNGYWIEVNLESLYKRGGLFDKLADDSFLSRGRTQDNGNYLEWPNGLTLGAETLWEWGQRVAGDDELTLGMDRPGFN
jgi:hypothetical protein